MIEEDKKAIRLTTAVHEAGHAWAYQRWGLPLRYVTVRPRTAGLTGRCAVWRPRYITRTQSQEIAAAGPVAEAIHAMRIERADKAEFRDFLQIVLITGGHGDVPKIGSLLEILTDNDGKKVFDPLEELYDLIMSDWHRIARTAEMLAAKGTMPGHEIFRELTAVTIEQDVVQLDEDASSAVVGS